MFKGRRVVKHPRQAIEWWITPATFLQEVEALPLNLGWPYGLSRWTKHGGTYILSVSDPAPFRTVSFSLPLLGSLLFGSSYHGRSKTGPLDQRPQRVPEGRGEDHLDS